MPIRTAALHRSRWLRLAAWGAFVVTVPSALWRVLMIVGLMPGTADLRQFELAGNPTLGYTYVFGLSIVQLGAGFLTVGFVRPWGEQFLGRRVPLAPVVAVATLGGLAVVWLFDINMVQALLTGQRPDDGRVSGVPLAVMVASYAPILLWGPLELLATYGYWLQRRRPAPEPERAVVPSQVAASTNAPVEQQAGSLPTR